MKTIGSSVFIVMSLVTLGMSASGQTFAGANLDSPPLSYTSETGNVATDVTYHPGVVPYVQLYTPDAGTVIGTDDRPEVSVTGPFGDLSSLTANFNLLSASPGVPPNGAYFDLFVQNPGNASDNLEIIGFSAGSLGVDTLNGSTQVHTLDGGAPPFAFGTSLSSVYGITDGTTTLGNWTVESVGVQIGGYGDYSGAMTDDISSITVGNPSVPDAATTLPLLGVCVGALAGLRRK